MVASSSVKAENIPFGRTLLPIAVPLYPVIGKSKITPQSKSASNLAFLRPLEAPDIDGDWGILRTAVQLFQILCLSQVTGNLLRTFRSCGGIIGHKEQLVR